MSSTLFAGLGSAADALDVLERAIGVVQNNVSNASTPGYVTQSLNLIASPFDAAENLWGGVQAGSVQSSRNQFAEESVWNANQQAGFATQQSTSLNALQQNFDVSGTSGIPKALSDLYSAFSAWNQNPTDTTSRQQVITAAQNLSQAFNQASTNIAQFRSQTDQQLTSTVTQVNQLTGQIASINAQIRDGGSQDAGLQTQLYNTLEQLSNLVPIQVQTESDGTATVLLNGQTALVLGQTQTQLQVNYPPVSSGALYPGAVPDAQLTTASGQDVTTLTNSGKLGALLQFRNTTVPSVLGDATQQGSLNQLAQNVADRVNTLLTSGDISSGPPAVAGVALFNFSTTSPTSAASTLSVNSSIDASQLAAIDPASGVANGIASQLAQLSSPQTAADEINGLSYTDFYSSVASDIGAQASSASAAEQTDTQSLTQAQNMRSQVSGVSLNDQAAQLLQFQEGYQAAAQVITTINNTTQSLLTMMQNLH